MSFLYQRALFFAIVLPMGYAYNIPAGHNGPKLLVDYVYKLADEKQELLPTIDLWLPTRRAERAIRQAFIDKFGASLLPRIRSMGLGEGQEEHLYLDQESPIDQVSDLDRLMYVARQVKMFKPQWQASQCFEQAEYLLKVKDRLTTYQVKDEDLQSLVPESYAEHWQNNLKFLEIVRFFYPQWLENQQKTDAATKLNQLLEQQITYYQQQPEQKVVAAGFADTIPQAMALLKQIYTMPNGAILLPGYYKTETTLTAAHPQYALHQLIAKVGIDTSCIKELAPSSARAALWQKALLPAEQTLEWQQLHVPADALENLTYVKLDDTEKEAEALALMMRETLEVSGKTAALVTNQRSLAHKVSALLKSKYGVEVNDSAGKALQVWPLGQYISLILDVIETKARPLSLVKLIQHPYTLCQFNVVKPLFVSLLRGLYPGEGLEAVDTKIKQAYQSLKPEKQSEEALMLWQNIQDIFTPLIDIEKTCHLPQFVEQIKEVFTALTEDQELEELLGQEDGESFMLLLAKWQQSTADLGAQPLSFFVDYLKILLEKTAVREKGTLHPRLFIWGPLEARFQHADRIIIAGLNEGNWPRKVVPEGWISGHMSETLGLPVSEMFTGLNAHDFYMLASKSEVLMTRSVKDAGVETLPSRFLMRFVASIQANNAQLYKAFLSSGDIWLKRLAALENKVQIQAISRPQVQVPMALRMRRWSVSQVKDIMYCPYKHFAQKILRIEELDDFEQLPSAREKGTLLHLVLEAFFKKVDGFPEPFGALTERNLRQAQAHLVKLMDLALQTMPQNVAQLWQQRFLTMVPDIIQYSFEQQQKGYKPLYMEQQGHMDITQGVSLTAIADRIDIHEHEKTACIIDYKTGGVPTKEEVVLGKQPQLILEALMLNKGQLIKNTAQAYTADATQYWKLSGGKEPVKISDAFDLKKFALEDLVTEAEEGLHELAEYMMSPETTYQARADKTGCKYCAYAHLCRKSEWEFKA